MLSLVSVVCCLVEVSVTGRSLAHRSPTDCDVSLCVIQKPKKMRRPWPTMGCYASGGGGECRTEVNHLEIYVKHRVYQDEFAILREDVPWVKRY
jgi:hypothetical protein